MSLRIQLIMLLGILLASVKLTLADSTCDSTNASCLPDGGLATCIAQICFIDSKSKKQFEEENNCEFRKDNCTNEIQQISEEVLKEIFPSSKSMVKLVSEELNLALKLEGAKQLINTKRKLAHFLAQVKQEVGSSARVEESLNYPPERLVKKFTNKAYGNRYGNGNAQSGDGWKYRGRGFIQLTFKANYLAFEKKYKKIWKDDISFVQKPDLVLEDKYVIRSALSFWSTNNLTAIADKGLTEKESREITEKVNLYTDSYGARFENLNEIIQIGFFKECE